MRYFSAVTRSIPMFLIAIIWGALGIPILWTPITLIASILLGLAIGHAMGATIVSGLLRGDGHFSPRRVPGGVWFFVVLGWLVVSYSE